ncbi:AraC family transcriptional regulator [Paenibacillus sp. 1011MAR3C5]|uniref:AraC family transcriptional regulator n=1 Tax=Paenibacillus sp. 1011MAR3C5 TaxID=1675787 RepID=UPI000E6C1538|nr:AraC family transcriptional regulator [Paenibacillus sp. 1011MAR3C5]RJE89696.1 AraC family transcriptional regulator [Paenibacillus sp. 1011MAR3C5]
MLEHLNRAIAYMEEHLDEELDMKEIARIALCSEHHFKRMFSFLAGVSLSEYVRRRRLTLAAMELQSTDERVIDIALKYGYGSPDAFTRAFQQLHGVTPSEARLPGQQLKAYPRMAFRLTIQGGMEMNFRIIEKEAFRIVGLMKTVSIQFEGVNPEIADMWKSLDGDKIALLKSLSNIEPRGMISASTHFSEGRMEERGTLDHYIGVATTEPAPEELAKLEVPAGTWAVFEAVGVFPTALQEVWGRIYAEWFPSSGYEIAEGPELLWNESKDTSSPAYRSEIWIPVMRKQGS